MLNNLELLVIFENCIIQIIDSGITKEARVEDHLEELGFGAVITIAALLLNRVLLILSATIISSSLGAAAYGVYSLSQKYLRIATYITTGSSVSIEHFLPSASTEKYHGCIIGYSLTASVTLGTLVALVFLSTAPSIVESSSQKEIFVPLLKFAALGIVPLAVIKASAAYFRADESPVISDSIEIFTLNVLGFISSLIGALFIGSIVSVAYLYLALVVTLSLCCLYVLTSRTRMVSFYRNRHQRVSEEAKEYGRKILVSRLEERLFMEVHSF